MSNTRTKFILVVEEPAPKDEDMRTVRQRLFVGQVCFAWLCMSLLALRGVGCYARCDWPSEFHNVCLQLFRRFHAAFIDVVSDPFYEIGQVGLEASALESLLSASSFHAAAHCMLH